MATVYRHLRNDTNTPFYVGAGKTTKRAYSTRDRNKHWHDVVNKHGYTVDIIHEGISWEEACKVEQYLIGFYGRKDLGLGTLVNMTDGGMGVVNLKQSEEARAKIGATLTGRKQNAETSAKRVATRKANGSYNWSEEHKAKVIAALTGKPNSKISAALTGRKLSEECKAKLRTTMTGRKQSAETSAKRVATRKANGSYGHSKSEETKARISAGNKGKPKSEEHKANMRKAAKLRWESRAGLQKRAEMSELLTNYHKSINN